MMTDRHGVRPRVDHTVVKRWTCTADHPCWIGRAIWKTIVYLWSCTTVLIAHGSMHAISTSSLCHTANNCTFAGSASSLSMFFLTNEELCRSIKMDEWNHVKRLIKRDAHRALDWLSIPCDPVEHKHDALPWVIIDPVMRFLRPGAELERRGPTQYITCELIIILARCNILYQTIYKYYLKISSSISRWFDDSINVDLIQ